MDLRNASIVITGAGGGVGPALALRLADHPPWFTLVGRRQQPLDELANRARQRGGQAHVGLPTSPNQARSRGWWLRLAPSPVG